MNRNDLHTLFAVVSIILFVACGGGNQVESGEQQGNAAPQTLPQRAAESRSASDWDMFPVSITEEAKGNGWKNVQVIIGYSNQTSSMLEPPNMTPILHQIKLNAEGGHSYDDIGIVSRGGVRQLGLTGEAVYPPDLKIKGYNSGKGGYSCPAPDSSKYDLATLEFEVGEKLKLESLSFPNGKTIDINEPEPDYPGEVPDAWLTEIGDEIETSTGLVVSLTSVKEDADKVTFEFEGTNTDLGKGVESGYLNVYILGDDGIVYQYCYSSRYGNVSEVGPGQTITFGGDVMFPKNVKSKYAVATMNFSGSGKETVAFIKMDN